MNRKIRIDAENLREQQAKRAEKEALLAQKKKEKEKRKSSIFSGWGGSSSNKNEDDDLEQNYDDEEEIHSLQITSKRNEANRRETEQLFFALSGAQIFFKRTDVDI